MVGKCIGPELDIQVGINQKGTHMVTNNTMSSFYWSILMRRISSSRVYFIVIIGKDVEDIRIRIKLSTLVHKDIFIFHPKLNFHKHDDKPQNLTSSSAVSVAFPNSLKHICCHYKCRHIRPLEFPLTSTCITDL